MIFYTFNHQTYSFRDVATGEHESRKHLASRPGMRHSVLCYNSSAPRQMSLTGGNDLVSRCLVHDHLNNAQKQGNRQVSECEQGASNIQ